MAEYAKFVRLYAPTTNYEGRGFQAKIKLPTTKSLGGSDDYINYYVGIGGYECGVSTARRDKFKDPVTGNYRWHWFVNTSNNDKKVDDAPMEFDDGDTVTLKLYLDDNSNKAVFLVNDVKKYEGSIVYTKLNENRLVFGAYQASGTTLPLTAWRVFQNNVTASNIYYKNTNKTWVPMTSGIPSRFYKPDVSSANMPDPDNWTSSSLSGGILTASI